MSTQSKTASTNSEQGFFFIGLACLFLIIIGWHVILFANQNYRQDEIITIHLAYAEDNAGVLNWLSHDGSHPAGWSLYAVEYVRFLGMDRSIVRFQSIFFTFITLATIYQLGKRLFDKHVGIIAVMFFGFSIFTAWHTHEFRPYAPLMAILTLLVIAYLRWLNHSSLINSIILFGLGALSMQLHYYAGWIMIILFLFTLFFTKLNRTKIYYLFGIFALVGASFAWWLPAILTGISERGTYAFENSLFVFLFINIGTFGFPFLTLFMFLPMRKRYRNRIAVENNLNQLFRNHVQWRQWLIFSLTAGIFGLLWTLNYFVQSLVGRQFLVAMPFFSIAVGYMLNFIAKPKLRYFTIGILIINFVLGSLLLNANFYPNMPFAEMADQIEPTFNDNTRIVTEINGLGVVNEAIVYYMMDKLPQHPDSTKFYAVVEPDYLDTSFWHYSVEKDLKKSQGDSFESLQEFRSFLQDVDRVWYIEYIGPPINDERPTGDIYRAILEENFILLETYEFKLDEANTFKLKEYIAEED